MKKLLLVILMALGTLIYNQPQSVLSASPMSSVRHVFIILEENHDLSAITPSAAPYINNTLYPAGSHATNYHNVASGSLHPSEPNYVYLEGGTNAYSDHTFTGDGDSTSSNSTSSTAHLSTLLTNAGFTWKSYQENVPSGCPISSSGGYAAKHNPFVFYKDVAGNPPSNSNASCASHHSNITASILQNDLNNNNVANYNFITPNLNDDMHDGSVTQGDTWLHTYVDIIRNSAIYKQDGLIIITWDEGGSGNNPIGLVLLSPFVKTGYSNNIAYSHASTVKTIENIFGLSPLVGHAADAGTSDFSDFFGVSGPTNTPTTVPTITNTLPPTNTPTLGPTPTSTNTRTSTPTRTATSVPNTSTPTNTPTTGPTPTSTNTVSSLVLPLRLTFFYPWFPEAWTQGGVYPYSQYTPTDGFYNSSDPVLVSKQIGEMQYAGIQGAIASWWGRGTPTDSRISTLLAMAGGTGFKWTLYYEPEGQGNPSSSVITNDLNYILAHYASNQNYMYINGKPVIFVYADATDSCSMVDRWKAANVGFYVVLKVFSGYSTCANQPDNWHQYSPAVSIDHQGTHSTSISPGFFKSGESTPRLARNLSIFNSNIQTMISNHSDFQLVTTWNEWGEGTSIEPSTVWNNDYLDALHNNGVVVPTPTFTNTVSVPTATNTTAPTNTFTPTVTDTPTSAPTITDTPIPTPTDTSVPSVTPIPTQACETTVTETTSYTITITVCQK